MDGAGQQADRLGRVTAAHLGPDRFQHHPVDLSSREPLPAPSGPSVRSTPADECQLRDKRGPRIWCSGSTISAPYSPQQRSALMPTVVVLILVAFFGVGLGLLAVPVTQGR